MVFLSRFSEVDAAILQQKAYKYLKYDTPARGSCSLYTSNPQPNTDCPQNTAPQLGKTAAAGPVLNLNQHKLIVRICSTQSWAPTREKSEQQRTPTNQQSAMNKRHPTTNKKQLLTTATVQPIIKSNTWIPIAFKQQLHRTHQNTKSLENTERPNRKQKPLLPHSLEANNNKPITPVILFTDPLQTCIPQQHASNAILTFHRQHLKNNVVELLVFDCAHLWSYFSFFLHCLIQSAV